MKLTFWGAAGGVTGSMHLVESGEKRYLLDCGLFQGRRKESDQKNRSFPFEGSAIDAVVLSHAHIDHSGRLPMLARNSYKGPIYATPATRDLCAIMLADSGVARLSRLYPRSIVKPGVRTILVPRPTTARIGGEPVRDVDLLNWCRAVITDVVGGVPATTSVAAGS